jgi:arylformamidase
VDLSLFIGPARVIEVPAGGVVSADVLGPWDWSKTPRCLLKTGGSSNCQCFNAGFVPVSEEAAHYLVQHGVRLVGTDSPSVDAHSSKDLPVHLIFGQGDVAILESLQLCGIPEGVYELIALPLRLVGLDASPVRAVLRSL